MKFYNLNPDLTKDHAYFQQQTWKKYMFDLDTRLNNVINYIDLFNPNFIILNYQYPKEKWENISQPLLTYYSDEELITIDDSSDEDLIDTSIITQSGNNYIVNVYKLMPHQGIINKYGPNVYLRFSPSQTLIEDKLPEGYIIFSNCQVEVNPENAQLETLKSTESATSYWYLYAPWIDVGHDVPLSAKGLSNSFDYYNILYDKNNYLMHAFGASGTYYLLNEWSPSAKWEYYPHGTDIFGSSIYFTISKKNTRWLYNDSATNHLQNISSISSAPLVYNDARHQDIVSKTGSWWTLNYILEYDILLNDEEVICDDSFVKANAPVDGSMKQYHTIITDIPSDTLTNLKVNYY